MPLFSIVIPTRERADTLAFSLKTCLNQDFDDYEIVVSDNCSSPATREVVEAAGSAKVKYVRSESPLAISASWEFAVSHASGEYVTVLGDDDGIMPYALRELDRLITRNDRPAVVHWHRGTYSWPNVAVPCEANVLRFPVTRFERRVSGRDILAMVSRYELSAASLPMINTAVIHKSLLSKHREIAGRLFVNQGTDIYTGYAFGYLCGTYVSVGVPMTFSGLSAKSTGVSTIFQGNKNPIADEHYRLCREAGIRWHPLLPDIELTHSHMDDAFLHAKDILFPDDPDLVLDRKRMIVRWLGMVTETDPRARAEVRTTIRASLSDSPDLLEWFDTEAPDPPPGPFYTHRPESFGLINNDSELAVDASGFGIEDIAGAVDFAAGMLGYRAGEIPYKSEAPRQAAS